MMLTGLLLMVLITKQAELFTDMHLAIQALSFTPDDRASRTVTSARWLMLRWLLIRTVPLLMVGSFADAEVVLINREQSSLEKGGSYQQPEAVIHKDSAKNNWTLSAGRLDGKTPGAAAPVTTNSKVEQAPQRTRDELYSDDIQQRNVTDAEDSSNGLVKVQPVDSRKIEQRDREIGLAHPSRLDTKTGTGKDPKDSARSAGSQAATPRGNTNTAQPALTPATAISALSSASKTVTYPKAPRLSPQEAVSALTASTGKTASPKVSTSASSSMRGDGARVADAAPVANAGVMRPDAPGRTVVSPAEVINQVVMPVSVPVSASRSSVSAPASNVVSDSRTSLASTGVSSGYGSSAVAASSIRATDKPVPGLPPLLSGAQAELPSVRTIEPARVQEPGIQTTHIVATGADDSSGSLSVPASVVYGALESRRDDSPSLTAAPATAINADHSPVSGASSSFEHWMQTEINRYLDGNSPVQTVSPAPPVSRPAVDPAVLNAWLDEQVATSREADSKPSGVNERVIPEQAPEVITKPVGESLPALLAPQATDENRDENRAVSGSVTPVPDILPPTVQPSEPEIPAAWPDTSPDALQTAPMALPDLSAKPSDPVQFDVSYLQDGDGSVQDAVENFVAWRGKGSADYLNSLKAILEYEVDSGTGRSGSVYGLKWDLLGQGLRQENKVQQQDALDAEIEQLALMADLHDKARQTFLLRTDAIRTRIRHLQLEQQVVLLHLLYQRKEKQLQAGVITRSQRDAIKGQRDNAIRTLALYRQLDQAGVSHGELALLNHIESVQLRSLDELNGLLLSNSLDLRLDQRRLERAAITPDYWDDVSLRLYVENRRDTITDDKNVVGVRAELPLGTTSAKNKAQSQQHAWSVRVRVQQQQLQSALRVSYQAFRNAMLKVLTLQQEQQTTRLRYQDLQALQGSGVSSLRLVKEDELEQNQLQQLALQQNILEQRLDAYIALWNIGWIANLGVEEVIMVRPS